MKNIHLLITGPIRPNINYINYIIHYFKQMIHNNVIVFLCYWKDKNIDKNMIKNVDYIFEEEEPNDDEIFKEITGRTIQQRQLNPKIEHWTPRIYKMFHGIKKMIHYIDNNSLIQDNDIVLRIRTDLFVEECDYKIFNILLQNIKNDTFYNKFRGHTCDWFSISTYNVFKKIWYIKNNSDYNIIINKLFNAEAIITYKSKINNIHLMNLGKIIKLCICRKYDNKNNPDLVNGEKKSNTKKLIILDNQTFFLSHVGLGK